MRRAARARHADEYDRDVVLAWQIERIAIMALKPDGTRQLPDLQRLLAKKKSGKQTPDEQRAVMHALSAKLGVPLERVKKGSDGRYHAAG